MSNRDHMMGYSPAANIEFGDHCPCVLAYPFGLPKRVEQETQRRYEKLVGSMEPKPIDPAEQLYMTANDVPGVLLAGDPAELRHSLDRIESKLGKPAAQAARDKLRERAHREGYVWHVAALDAWTYERAEKANQATINRNAGEIEKRATAMQMLQQAAQAQQYRDELMARNGYETMRVTLDQQQPVLFASDKECAMAVGVLGGLTFVPKSDANIPDWLDGFRN